MYNTIIPNSTSFVINGTPITFGKITVIEGPDGVGKSTFVQQVTSELNDVGKTVRVLRFPDNRENLPFRKMIMSDEVGKHPSTEVFLFLADFVYTLQEEVIPHLEDDNILFLFDRFIPSTCVYQNVDPETIGYILDKTQPAPIDRVIREIDYLYLMPTSVEDLKFRLGSKRNEDINRLDPKTAEHAEMQLNKYVKFINEHLHNHQNSNDPLHARSVKTLQV